MMNCRALFTIAADMRERMKREKKALRTKINNNSYLAILLTMKAFIPFLLAGVF